MKLNKNDLRKIQYDFNSYSNRLLQANYMDYADVLRKYLNYLTNTPVVFDYIQSCGTCDMDVEGTVKDVQQSCGRLIFVPGDTEKEEIRNIYAIFKIYCRS